MVDQVRAEVDFSEVEHLARVSPGILRRNVGQSIGHMLDDFTNEVSGRMRPYRGRSYRFRLQTRTGALRRSISRTKVKFTATGAEAQAFTTSKYARIQEFGGTITPKRRKYLTIPLRDALTAGGDLKGGAMLVQRGSHWETADGRRTYIAKGVIFATKYRPKKPRGARKSYVSEKYGPHPVRPVEQRRGGDDALYVLKRSVTLPPGRLGWFRTFRNQANDRARRLKAAIELSLLEASR